MSATETFAKIAGIAILCLGSLNPANAAQGQRKAKKPDLPPLPSGPTGPVPHVPLDSIAPVPPQVSYQNGQLTIVAANSTLGDILRAVRKQTGAEIEIPEARERVVTHLGPGPAREVMVELLNGSRFNYVLLGSPQDASALTRVVLVPKTGPDNTTLNAQQTQPQPIVNQNANMAQPQEVLDANDADAVEENADESADQGAESEQPAAPGQQPEVKTPQQMLQEMQQRQLQLQQQQLQGQPPNPGPGGVPQRPPQEQQ